MAGFLRLLARCLFQPILASQRVELLSAGYIFEELAVSICNITARLFEVNGMLTFFRSCIISFTLFAVTLFLLSQLSTPSSSTPAYIGVIFLNGLCTGAALNYTLAHILHLSLSETHFIATALLATFRGFAGSFGSAIGGGIFKRLLQSSLEQGFKGKGLSGKKELIRQLLGSPELVSSLKGDDKEVAIAGYVTALQGLFFAASGLAIIMIIVQAGTGWRAPVEENADETSDTEGEDE